MKQSSRSERIALVREILSGLGAEFEPRQFQIKRSQLLWRLLEPERCEEFILFTRATILPNNAPATLINPTLVISFPSVDRIARALDPYLDKSKHTVASVGGNTGLFHDDKRSTWEPCLTDMADVGPITAALRVEINRVVFPLFDAIETPYDLLELEVRNERVRSSLAANPIAYLALVAVTRGTEAGRALMEEKPGAFRPYGGWNIVMERLAKIPSQWLQSQEVA